MDDADDLFPRFIGRCVYCDSTDDLSDEHVVPYGLGGVWKLLKASCRKCRDATSEVELRVLREHFHAIRTVAELPTRRPHMRPGTFPVKLQAGGRPITLEVKRDDHPAPLVLPIFPPPSAIEAASGGEMRYEGIRVARRRGRLEAIARDAEADKWTFPCADPETFARFLAKVGYCFAVGSYGLENIAQHTVRTFIVRGGTGIAPWVGCVDTPGEYTDNGGHQLTCVVEGEFIVVRMRFFSIPNAPTYAVLAGKPV